MKVLVAGGTGFLGQYVVREFRSSGHDVAGVGRRDGVDLTILDQAVAVARDARPDVIVNCAAVQGGLEFVRRHPARIFRDNVFINMNVLEAAAVVGVPRVINVLAACSYPGEVDGHMTEARWWDGPLHDSVLAYGFTKKAAWVYGWCLAAEQRLSVTSLLLANLYGPGEHMDPERSHALGALVRKIVDARRDGQGSVEVWGTGRPVRDWLFVEDAAHAVVAAAELPNETSHLFNVGSGDGIAIADLAEAIGVAAGWKGELRYDTERPDGAAYKVLDSRPFQEATGWRPKVPLSEGLRRTVAAYAGHA